MANWPWTSMSENGQTGRPELAIVFPMDLTRDDYYRALKARDPRFDGEFFTCVSSTGIYCRPICPANRPKIENCSFVRSAAAAEDAGYRPCLRCRPETAPGSPAWNGTGTTVARAMRLLSENDGEGNSLEDLSDRLGVGSRHLRRLFAEQVGAAPKALIQTQRLHMALHLLKETDISIARICDASGFRSIRRFNDAMKKTVGMSPNAFRERHQMKSVTKAKAPVHVRLGYRPPFDWDGLVSYLGFRAIPGVESVSDGSYFRTIDIDAARGVLKVSHDPKTKAVVADFIVDEPVGLIGAVRKVRDLVDTDCRPDALTETFKKDKRLGSLLKARPGVRVPGCWSVFELILRAIVGQQISVKGATTMLSRLAKTYGREISTLEPNLTSLFPTPAELVDQDLTSIGLTRSRAQTIQDIAADFVEDPHFVHPAMPTAEAMTRLMAIKGIGDWTAQYVALRALRSPDAFPSADLGLMKAAQIDSPKELKAMSEAWRPWRGYAALLLWHSLS